MATNKIQLRRDGAAVWTSVNPTLADGELGFESDTKYAKIGDGTTPWRTLAYLQSGPATTTPAPPSPTPAPPAPTPSPPAPTPSPPAPTPPAPPPPAPSPPAPSVPDTRPRTAIGGPAVALATLFAGATVAAGSSNGSTVTGPWTVTPGVGQYAYAFFPQTAYAVRPGVIFNDGTGNGGWSGAGMSGDNNGASPPTSVSGVTYSDGTTTWVVFRTDTSEAFGTFTTT